MAILGPLFSSHAVKVGPIINIPTIVGATGANVTETGEFLFLAASSNALQAKLMAQFAVNELSAKTAAMIWQNADVYSIGFVEAFDANFQVLGGSIVPSETYETGDMTFDTQLTAIKKANPDVFFLASFPPENPLIMKQARDMGIESVFKGTKPVFVIQMRDVRRLLHGQKATTQKATVLKVCLLWCGSGSAWAVQDFGQKSGRSAYTIHLLHFGVQGLDNKCYPSLRNPSATGQHTPRIVKVDKQSHRVPLY